MASHHPILLSAHPMIHRKPKNVVAILPKISNSHIGVHIDHIMPYNKNILMVAYCILVATACVAGRHHLDLTGWLAGWMGGWMAGGNSTQQRRRWRVCGF